MKKVLITGVTGQDGSYLAEYLLKKGYKVYGCYRRSSSPNFWRLLSLGIIDKVHLIPSDMTDSASILNAIIQSEPDEIYNLAAQSFVGTSFEQPLFTAAVDGLGVTSILECIKNVNRKIRFYNASTSEMYGNSNSNDATDMPILTEDSVFHPASPYAASKLYAYHKVRIYREAYGMFAVNGILFNHESPLRGLEFVTRKISNAVARIKVGLQEKIRLGNLDAKRDWGYAPEYIEAMWLMLQQDSPDDYVIATGESHSVQEYLELACEFAGLDPEKVYKQDDRFTRPIDVENLCGSSQKAEKLLGWKAEVKFKKLVELMVMKDISRWERHLGGKIFPWDAINDPNIY